MDKHTQFKKKITRHSKAFVVLAIGLIFSCPPVDAKNWAVKKVNNLLENKLHHLKSPERQYVSGEPLQSSIKVLKFYEWRKLKAAWINNSGLRSEADDLIKALMEAPKEGLEPKEYHSDLIMKLCSKSSTLSVSELADLDLLLSDAFLTYGTHLLAGRVNPAEIDEEWIANRRDADLPKVLEESLEGGKIRSLLKELLPTQKAYSKLRMALARYRAIEKEGGWVHISTGPTIKVGQSDPRSILLRARLFMEGDLNQIPNENEYFDEALRRGLIRFQNRHGLQPDGFLGNETIQVLNVPVTNRIEQIKLNMERCRWLPQDMGSRYVVVNIANYSLDIIEEENPALSLKVVVGKRYRRTPVFSSIITDVVANPSWTVPKKMARLDILRKIQKNPNFLAEENFRIYDSYDENARIVEWKHIDWSTMTPNNLPFRFRQKPGPRNALGRMKFLIVNDFDVYLHDTPSRELFNKTIRSFSSGCIRVENPIELAQYLLHNNPEGADVRFQASLLTQDEQYFRLKDPMPIHILYWTAWVDERGKMQFRDDIYRRDLRLKAALAGKPLPAQEEEDEDGR